MKEKYVVLKVKKEDLEDAIDGFKLLKPMIQSQVRSGNGNNIAQADKDVAEVGKHFDTAITSMTMLLGSIMDAE